MSHYWTPDEEAKLRELYQQFSNRAIGTALGRSESSIQNRAGKRGLSKPDGYKNQGCFEKGNVPWNLGTHYNAGGRCAETQFKPNHRSGRALALYQPIGTERVSKDGYLQRKINDDMPLQGRWRGVHILQWEAINGPLPKGHALVFIDGDKKNCNPNNLELVTRAELMRRNSVHQYGKEIAAIIQLKGAITRQLNRKAKDEHA